MSKELPSFHHRVLGQNQAAPWLTFIPGIGNDLSFWQAQAEILAQDFQVLLFDPWGHHLSPLPPQDCRFADIEQGIVKLWDSLGIASSHVVGLGFGGSLSLSLGLNHAEHVDSIVACCCRARQPDDRHGFWRARLAQAQQNGLDELGDVTVERWLSEDFRASHPEVDAQLRAMIKRTAVEGYCAYVQAFIEMDFSEHLEQIQQPVLLLAAEHDHGGGPVPDMQAMAQRLPNAQLHVITGSGHICNFEAPVQVQQQLQNFLQPAKVA